MVVPGSGLVRQEAEKEGLDKIFKEAGFESGNNGVSSSQISISILFKLAAVSIVVKSIEITFKSSIKVVIQAKI